MAHIVKQRINGKYLSPQQLCTIMRKYEQNKISMIKQLSQLGIDQNQLHNKNLNDLHSNCDNLLKSSYSIKYLGVNEDDEIGIVSKRINPFDRYSESKVYGNQTAFTINQYFLPKPLRVAKKCKKTNKNNCVEEEIKKAIDLHNNKINETIKKKNRIYTEPNQKTKIKQKMPNLVNLQTKSKQNQSNHNYKFSQLPIQNIKNRHNLISYSRQLMNGKIQLTKKN